MAKVEIEDRAFQDPDLVAAASKHKVSKAEIMGYATWLWRMSQQARVIEADKETILGWLDTDRRAKPKRAFGWLLASGHLVATDDQNIFKIHGNSFRIPRIAKRIENAKNAVTIREQKKSSIDSISDRSSTRYPDSKTVIQARKKPPVDPAGPTTALPNISAIHDAPKGGDVWTAYRAAYFARYKVEPVRNAKSNSNCVELIKRLGGDGAISVVKFFLTHNQAFYVAKAHPLGLCVADAEGLHTQMLAGHRISASEAREKDLGQGNAQAFANVYEKLKAKGVLE